jgi:hypothetical protein
MTTVLEFKTADEKQIDDYRKASNLCAKLNYIFYQAHVDAGFTPEQAMMLMTTESYETDVDY